MAICKLCISVFLESFEKSRAFTVFIIRIHLNYKIKIRTDKRKAKYKIFLLKSCTICLTLFISSLNRRDLTPGSTLRKSRILPEIALIDAQKI